MSLIKAKKLLNSIFSYIKESDINITNPTTVIINNNPDSEVYDDEMQIPDGGLPPNIQIDPQGDIPPGAIPPDQQPIPTVPQPGLEPTFSGTKEFLDPHSPYYEDDLDDTQLPPVDLPIPDQTTQTPIDPGMGGMPPIDGSSLPPQDDVYDDEIQNQIPIQAEPQIDTIPQQQLPSDGQPPAPPVGGEIPLPFDDMLLPDNQELPYDDEINMGVPANIPQDQNIPIDPNMLGGDIPPPPPGVGMDPSMGGMPPLPPMDQGAGGLPPMTGEPALPMDPGMGDPMMGGLPPGGPPPPMGGDPGLPPMGMDPNMGPPPPMGMDPGMGGAPPIGMGDPMMGGLPPVEDQPSEISGKVGKSTKQKINVDDLNKLNELKNIHKRLINVKKILEPEVKVHYEKIKGRLEDSLDYFSDIIQNLDSFSDTIDNIIIRYKKFVFIILKEIENLKQLDISEEEND